VGDDEALGWDIDTPDDLALFDSLHRPTLKSPAPKGAGNLEGAGNLGGASPATTPGQP
jgi:hypothetical protein